MRSRKSILTLKLLILASCTIGGATTRAASLTAGNLIVSVNEFTGLSTAPTYIAEYTTSGSRVQIIANVPNPDGTGDPNDEQARDLILGPDNAIYLYNGTFDPTLARFDLETTGVSQQSFAGWSTVNNITYGGLDRLGQYIFATDMETAGGGTPQGVIRFDTAGGPTVRFAETVEPIDLNIGPDGLLYALDGLDTVFTFDPLTFAALGSVALDFDSHRAIAVAGDGSIYSATFGGEIKHFSASGTLLNSLTVAGANFGDIDIGVDGRIALGTGFDGEVVLTDLSLDSFTRFRATDSTSGGEVFVSWVNPALAIPEPSSMALVSIGAVALAASSRLRRRDGRDRA